MRVAYVINSVEGGGAAGPVPALTRILRDQGAEVRVFALARRDGRALPAMQAAGLDPLVREGGLHDHWAALRWLSAETAAWGATHLWTSLTRASILGLLLGSRRDVPVFCWQHNAYLRRGNRLLLRAMQGRARLWIADSESVARFTRQELGVQASRVLAWPIFAADPAAPRAVPWRPGQHLELGSLGRLHPNKGYDVLIEALGLLRRQGFRAPVPYSLTVCGEGRERERLESQARTAGIGNLRFPGYSARPQRFLADLHLYLQPSRAEGFCIAAHEAMAAGLPVVASAVGELQHSIVDGISGQLVPPGVMGALADALHKLLAQPDRLHRMGVEARDRVMEKFSRERFAATGAELFNRMQAAGSPARAQA
jgi:glycosyltransferase involved in cell wall biosynthesis